MGTLGVAFFRLQILHSSVWALRAESNRLHPVTEPAPRGVIYDRQGRVLAENVPGYTILLLPNSLSAARASLEKMRRELQLPDIVVARSLTSLERYGLQPLVVEADAGFELVSKLEERRGEFPGVVVEMTPRRHYPAGPATAHVLGYVGRISSEELGSGRFAGTRYSANAVVGKAGLEREYEEVLRGRDGIRYLEVDARGRVVGDGAGVAEDPPVGGKDLWLNLDRELQEWVDGIFPDSLSGAVVALDPEDGGVLALYSAPAFDANLLVGGLDPGRWARLRSDPRRPLFNRAVLGLYPPASTWKLASAAIALNRGALTPSETMPEPCTGAFRWGNRVWHCWQRSGHGYLDLAGAIAHSCDVYFYQLGLKVGLDGLIESALDMGFAAPTGIDLPQESRGVFPESREYWVRRWGYEPTEGEVLSLAIGQGPNAQTPLKIAQLYLALARDGSAPAPTLARGAEPREGWRLDLTPEQLRALREGLRRVTAPGGTAHLEATLERWDLIGKTGTAQHSATLDGRSATHAWFAAIAGPRGAPAEVVVVALVEFGGSGSALAARLAAKTADFYLRRKHGIPVDSLQTLGEYIQARGWPAWHEKSDSLGGP